MPGSIHKKGAERVPIPGRVFWVLDTFDILEEAKRLSDENPLVRWAAGLIYAQVPGFFGKRDEDEKASDEPAQETKLVDGLEVLPSAADQDEDDDEEQEAKDRERKRLQRLRRVGREEGADVPEAIALLRQYEGSPKQTRYLDAIIDPAETRPLVIRAIAALRGRRRA